MKKSSARRLRFTTQYHPIAIIQSLKGFGGGYRNKKTPYQENAIFSAETLGGKVISKAITLYQPIPPSPSSNQNNAPNASHIIQQHILATRRTCPSDMRMVHYDKQQTTLGDGGFGTVFVATLRGVQVAVKKLNNQNVRPHLLEDMRDELLKYQELQVCVAASALFGGCGARVFPMRFRHVAWSKRRDGGPSSFFVRLILGIDRVLF